MSLQEIFESERRNKDNLYDIHFYMDGAFWRAYEWSAYLSRIFPSGLNDDERLNPFKKAVKWNEEGCVQVGLQLPSFNKYFPSVTDNEKIFEMSNKHIIIHAESFFTDKDFSKYEDILNEWKNGIKLSQKENKKNKEYKTESIEPKSMDSLVKEITSYPIETKSLVDCVQFLSYIRMEIMKITKQDKMNS